MNFLFSERRGSEDAEPHLTLNLEDRDHFSARILPRPNISSKHTATTRQRDSHKRMDAVMRAAKEYQINPN